MRIVSAKLWRHGALERTYVLAQRLLCCWLAGARASTAQGARGLLAQSVGEGKRSRNSGAEKDAPTRNDIGTSREVNRQSGAAARVIPDVESCHVLGRQNTRRPRPNSYGSHIKRSCFFLAVPVRGASDVLKAVSYQNGIVTTALRIADTWQRWPGLLHLRVLSY